MKYRILRQLSLAAASLLLPLAAVTGCRSHHVEVTVENRTGAPVQLLEVDYPSASFGADKLAVDGNLHYRIQVRGSGPVKVQYTVLDVSQPLITGPSISEGEEGQLKIVLLPGGKAEFLPQLTPGH